MTGEITRAIKVLEGLQYTNVGNFKRNHVTEALKELKAFKEGAPDLSKRKIRDKNFKRFKSYVDDIEIVHNNRRSKYNFTDDFIESLKWAVKELEG